MRAEKIKKGPGMNDVGGVPRLDANHQREHRGRVPQGFHHRRDTVIFILQGFFAGLEIN